ncbi:MAG: HrcA family transcriptional regulator, partial [Cyanobacteria bacterium REEB65]|nr:HrcA family transcriptional regulator [Cyanobacteria bacterium REEB65]
MRSPFLTPRQQEILRAVVSDYILTAEPVGSRTLSRKYELGLSAATIRNELADLEEEGLLRQPHTSAGRIPSDFGYRVFVDDLMGPPRLAPDKEAILDQVAEQAQDLQELLHQTARLTAVLAGCTALVR